LILKRNIYNTIRCKISKLYDDDDVLYSLHSTPPHSPWHRLLTTAAPQMSIWLSCGWCQLLSDRYRIECHNEEKYHPIAILPNICKYCPVPNYPMSVSF